MAASERSAMVSGAPSPLPASRAQIALALGTVYLVWGSTYLGIRWVVAELPPFAAGAVRFVTAGGVFLLVGLLTGGPLPTRRQLRNAALVGIFLPGISNGLVGLAERRVPSSITALVLAVMPLWMALLETVRPGGTRPSRRAALGLLLGFGGTALLVLGGGRGQQVIEPLGVGLLLLASFIWAAGSLFARGAARPGSWMVSAGTEMLAGGLCQATLALVQGELPRLAAAHPSGRALGALVYLIAIGAWLGYGAFSWLTRRARPAVVATYAYVNPLVAVVLGSLLAGEVLAPRAAVSGVVIVAAVVLVTTARK
jgi:drug/metabolite transporter (DMT)-like permease